MQLDKFQIIVVVLYRPGTANSADVIDFIDRFDLLISTLRDKFNIPLLICADLNINNLERSWESQLLQDLLECNNLNIIFKGPTRVTPDCITQLDYFIVDSCVAHMFRAPSAKPVFFLTTICYQYTCYVNVLEREM